MWEVHDTEWWATVSTTFKIPLSQLPCIWYLSLSAHEKLWFFWAFCPVRGFEANIELLICKIKSGRYNDFCSLLSSGWETPFRGKSISRWAISLEFLAEQFLLSQLITIHPCLSTPDPISRKAKCLQGLSYLHCIWRNLISKRILATLKPPCLDWGKCKLPLNYMAHDKNEHLACQIQKHTMQ